MRVLICCRLPYVAMRFLPLHTLMAGMLVMSCRYSSSVCHINTQPALGCMHTSMPASMPAQHAHATTYAMYIDMYIDT